MRKEHLVKKIGLSAGSQHQRALMLQGDTHRVLFLRSCSLPAREGLSRGRGGKKDFVAE